jgi:hypothetical protein
VVEHHDGPGGGYGSGALVALAAVVVLAVIAFAVLWTQPWDDDGGADTTPGISDNIVPDGGDGGGTGGDGGTGGGDGGGTGGGTGGGGGTDGGGGAPAQ